MPPGKLPFFAVDLETSAGYKEGILTLHHSQW